MSTTPSTMATGLRWLANQQIPVATVLDVGASDGRWTEDCMVHFPEAKYVLYEPQPAHDDALCACLRRHPGSVTVIRQAVGASVGQTHFDMTDAFGGALADRATPTTRAVAMTTLDASLAGTGPFLLKLDTHGYERSIFAGAAETLPQCSALIVEAYNFRITDEAFLFWELCAFLAERGFRPVDVMDVVHRPYDNALWQMDVVFVRDSWAGFPHRGYR